MWSRCPNQRWQSLEEVRVLGRTLIIIIAYETIAYTLPYHHRMRSTRSHRTVRFLFFSWGQIFRSDEIHDVPNTHRRFTVFVFTVPAPGTHAGPDDKFLFIHTLRNSSRKGLTWFKVWHCSPSYVNLRRTRRSTRHDTDKSSVLISLNRYDCCTSIRDTLRARASLY